ncbi:MAG: NUDIX domain-containing protein [Pseudomonadales bacterium]
MDRDRFPVVVHVMLWRDAHLFLLRRGKTGFLDGFYALPGGHQHAGESVQDAAVRECKEETGTEIIVAHPLCTLPYLSGFQQGVNFVFEAHYEAGDWTGDPYCAEPALFDRGDWFDPPALPDPVIPWIRDVLVMRSQGLWFREYRTR